MGGARRLERHAPQHLAEKLLRIRTDLGLSQNEMLRRLGSPEKLLQSSISGYERGLREPPLLILLEYARIANLYVDVLLDDTLELPATLPARTKSEGIERSPFAGRSAKKRGGK